VWREYAHAMLRWLVVALALVAALAGASPAGAQAPRPTVSTNSGTVTPSYLSGTETPRSGDGPTLIKDGFGLNPPTLDAQPGSVVMITLASAADAVVAFLGSTSLPVTAAGANAYAVTVPVGAPLPARFSFRVDSSTETTLLTDAWLLNLGGDIVDPAPLPVPTAPPVSNPAPVAGPLPPLPLARSLRLRGARLSAVVSCPAARPTACAGTLTLRTSGRRVAQLRFAGVAPGAQTTLRTTLSASTRRYLRRHRVRTLRAVLTPTGGPAISSLLALH
jgi:hypothetical protein